MAIEVKCDVDGCKKPIGPMPGALVFSPPVDDRCVKLHVCPSCYDLILRRFFYQGSRGDGNA